ncbi:XRE family transcriptional regulator [Streptomyces alfalfae]|uniref:helix-turn-helix domain-containing protein n=1 Tax=Streptomyces alfalfae TaxID=1642299 RepID=UPI0009A167C6|nr:helix-turn-helix transcriptional regulator [Streptomyces alfalfae]AYA15980.1 XRE family transcriptional regulator [Streptomyces fradiae]QUI34648.1 helix-turn-helix domain-containing protein [Streptomyces alfalfae]RXX39453.1 XRE family transcriptional regulator [Streptomyces alfalfae]RZM83748.1 XRE family transcriptional regulator [Streptomyces alfalfae]
MRSSCAPGGSEPEPTEGLKAFGAVLKSFRKRAGYTQESLARHLGYSAHFIASVEQGRRFPPTQFIDLCETALDAFDTLRMAAGQLSRQRGLASWFRQWAQLEQEAVALSTYECRLIPGLLQTQAYARTLFVNQLPPLGDNQIEAQLEARSERQLLLTERPNTAYSFILEEHLFLRGMGGHEVTMELVDHVLGLAEHRNIELQIMPVVRTSHAGMDGPIQLLETPENRWFAYAEGQRNGQFISQPKEISVLQMRYARMRAQALSFDDSVSLLKRMRGAQ